MKARITKGRDIRALFACLTDPEKQPSIVGGNVVENAALSPFPSEGIIRVFEDSAAQQPELDTPFAHITLSLPRGESLDQDTWEILSADWMMLMGIDGGGILRRSEESEENPSNFLRKYAVIRHAYHPCDHVHIVASRVAQDDTVWNQVFDFWKGMSVCREIETLYDLQAVSVDTMQHRARVKGSELRMAERTGRIPEKISIQEILDDLLLEHNGYTFLSLQYFCDQLEKRGVIAIPKLSDNGEMYGFAFQHSARSLSGKDSGYPWSLLQEFLEPADDSVEWLRKRQERLCRGSFSDAVRSVRNAVWEYAVRETEFRKALKKQGWILKNDTLISDEANFLLSDFLDLELLVRNLEHIGGTSNEKWQRAEEICSRIAFLQPDYHPLLDFLNEMPLTDSIFALLAYPESFSFLLALSALAKIARHMPRESIIVGRDEIWNAAMIHAAEEKARMEQAINDLTQLVQRE